ncbi:hypothetical protein ACJJTC_011637 [Scirpophaga incertulas]
MSTFKEAMHLIIQQHHDNYTKKLDSLDLAISNFKDEQDDISKRIASSVGVTITAQDVEFATRLPTRAKNSGLPKTVIIKFKTVQLRVSLLSAARKKRGLTTADINIPGDVRSIYVNEHLTPRNKTLLKLTRAKCKELGFQNVWTRNTKIYVRKHVKSPAIRIFNFEQIDKLGK